MQKRSTILTTLFAIATIACASAVRAEDEFCGIGAGLKLEGNAVKVQKVFPGSGAAEAGLSSGSIVTHVDGKPLRGLSLQDVVALIRGKEGTSVRLTILKELGLTENLKIVRMRIARVEAETLPGVYSFQASPSTTVTIKRTTDSQFTIDCPQQHWHGVGLLGNGYVKGVFRMDDDRQVHKNFRGAISFFRIDFQFGNTLQLRSRFNFYDSGDKIVEKTLVKRQDQTEQ